MGVTHLVPQGEALLDHAGSLSSRDTIEDEDLQDHLIALSYPLLWAHSVISN